MALSARLIRERNKSAFDLSIGTAHAMESIFPPRQAPYDPSRVIPQKVDLGKYSYFWINVRTLFRNLIGSIQSPGGIADLDADDISLALTQESDYIIRLINDAHPGVRPVFYACSYNNLEKKYPHAKIRYDKTDKQQMTSQLLGKVIPDYFSNKSEGGTYHLFSEGINNSIGGKTLILTHYALDLLERRLFGELHLIESNTGVLKTKELWYTKYTDGGQYNMLPFNACFLQVFGDSTSFYSLNQAVRKQILELASKYRWTPASTTERIKFGIDSMTDKYTREILLSMLK